MKENSRYLFLFFALLAFSHPGIVPAADNPFFIVESPAGPGSGAEIWERLEVGGKEYAVVSALSGRREVFADIGPLEGDQALFVISARRGIDLPLISQSGTVLLSDGRVALAKTDQKSAELLAGEGMELKRVMPPIVRGPSAAAPRPELKTRAADPRLQQIIDAVTWSEVSSLLGNLSGENSVTIGGSPYTIQTRNSYQATPISQATQYCYEYFQNLGLSASYGNYSWSGNNWRNVVAEQSGTVNPGNIYIICAHLDDMPSGVTAPGADDNASGSTAVLLAASILSDYDLENTIRYVLFTGEEQGLIGSYYYVLDLLGSGDTVLGAFNLDMVAYDGNADTKMEVYCGSMAASQAIGDLLIDTISQYGLSLVPMKLTSAPSWSDQARFWDAGYPAIVGIEADDDFNPFYHTVNDTRANCNLPYLTQIVKAAVGTTARLGVLVASPTPSPTMTPIQTSTATPSPTPSPSSPLPAPSCTPSLTDTPSPTPTPSPLPTAYSPLPIIASGDYNGDGTSDIAVFRPGLGLWAVRSVTRLYYGAATDIPAPGDYDGDGTAEIGVFRSSSGLWGIRDLTRLYYGGSSDTAVPGDYDGDETTDIGIFRPSSGLWGIKDVTRVYFGSSSDTAVPGDYDGDGTGDIALFRGSSGLWAIRLVSRIYYGGTADRVVPGEYDGDGTWEVGIFRPSTGMWGIRGLTRAYFGGASDQPVSADYNGDSVDNLGIFRPTTGLWAVRNLTRAYFGATGDIPVTR